MYKLLIVDDEQIVTDSIKFIIEKFMPCGIQTETANSGREAIEKTMSYHPDFVIIDIKMPGISGLDAIKEIKKIYSGALFIIISAFAKFDYAKEAISLGVIEYINKPLSRDSLISALNHAIEIKGKEQAMLKVELDYKEKMAFIGPTLENSFIDYIVLSDSRTAEIESLGRILGLTSGCGYIMAVRFREKGNSQDKPDTDSQSRNIDTFLRETIKETCESIVGPVFVNHVVAYIPCGRSEEDGGQKAESLRLGSRIFEKLKGYGNIDFFLGIGRKYTLEKIHGSYEESMKAIDYENACGVAHIDDIPAGWDFKKEYPKEVEKQILKNINSGETDAGIFAFEYMFNWLQGRYGGNIEELKSSLIELVVLIFGIPKSYGLEDQAPAGSGYIKEFMALKNLKQVNSWIIGNISMISEKVARVREKKYSSAVKSAVDYITRNYNSNITLESVSKAVNVSPTYLSKIFREEVGTTFISYLTTLRIKHAQKLISDSNIGNKEICDVIGYSDPNYFSRVFKKVVGVTPTEYRSSSLN